MGQQRTDASLICNYKRAADRVLKQANAEAAALVHKEAHGLVADDLFEVQEGS